MDGIPPAIPTDSEDVVWALQTADSLWKRGERLDAVVWLRRAAQAAGDGDDAKRAATLARRAAELTDAVKGKGPPASARKPPLGLRPQSLEDLDRSLGDPKIERAKPPPKPAPKPRVESSGSIDVEVVSSNAFEAGLRAPSVPSPRQPSEGPVMTISDHAPDVELIEDEHLVEDDDLETEPTPVKSPAPLRPPSEVPSAAEAHAGMLDPWDESRLSLPGAFGARRSRFDEEEIVTSAQRTAPPVSSAPRGPATPRAPVTAPRPPPPVAPTAPPADEDSESTAYRQVSPRTRPRRLEGEPPSAPRSLPPRPATKPPTSAPRRPPPAPRAQAAPSPPPPPKPVSERPSHDLLEMVDAVSSPEPAPPVTARPASPAPPSPTVAPPSFPGAAPVQFLESSPGLPRPSVLPTPYPVPSSPSRSVPVSARPTAPPPSSIGFDSPSSPPTRPNLGSTLLDLSAVEALGDLPDDAREAFAAAATIHSISVEEEVSHFALALVIDGAIDVSATIVDAPALKLERNAVLRSRGTLPGGVPLRLVGSSPTARIATWDDAAVAQAFRSCPWVEDDLRAVADKVQAKVGLTMGPLGERWDLSLREYLIDKLTLRALGPGEVLVAEGKAVPLAIVGVGEIVVTRGAEKSTLGPGDFVFPTQILAHASAPATAAAAAGGALVFYGDRPATQELLMSFPPILEVLATI